MQDCEVFDGCDGLKQFGVIPLTGEACGLAMRILCDLTEEGVQLIRDFMRVEPTAEPWNNDGVKSIMLPISIFQELWIFAHIREGVKDVFLGGYCNADEWTETHYETINETVKHPVKTWRPQAYAVSNPEIMETLREYNGKCFYIARWYKRSKHPGTGLDNQHAMSGRIV